MISLEDEKSRKLGEAISNPTCKKIISLLAEKELSATEISREIKIPMNTLDYNLKKLISSGIIEKSKHFWSVKGKKIPTYKVVNKVIVIQPKNIKFKCLVQAQEHFVDDRHLSHINRPGGLAHKKFLY